MTCVPFTWIIKFTTVASVTWDKQAFLAKLGFPAHDPILSARPAVLAHQKNAPQAAQVLQQCNTVLGLPSTPQQSLASRQLLPSCSPVAHSCAYQTPMGVPPSPRPLCRPEPVPKRLRFELVDGEPSAEQQLAPKRRKRTLFRASLQLSANHTGPVVTDTQTDQVKGGSLNSSKQGPEHEEGAGTHHRPGREQTGPVALGKHKQLGRCSHGPMTTTPQTKLYSHDHELASNDKWAQLPAENPQSATQPASFPHFIAQTPSVEPEMSSKKVSAEVQQETAADDNPGVATQDDVSNSAALAMTPTMTSAQQNVLFGLTCHFCAKKGPSWLFL
ncbi:hypothetical protein ABBQ32_003144 [Trebouxia sp. C0010 RCD-2024]